MTDTPTTATEDVVLSAADLDAIRRNHERSYPHPGPGWEIWARDQAIPRLLDQVATLTAELAASREREARLRDALGLTDSALAYARDALEESGDRAAVQRIDEATHERDERARAALAAVDGEPQP